MRAECWKDPPRTGPAPPPSTPRPRGPSSPGNFARRRNPRSQTSERPCVSPDASATPCTNLMNGAGALELRRDPQRRPVADDRRPQRTAPRDTEQALQDLEALASLAQLDREEYTLIAQAIRVAVANLGRASWEALLAPGWTNPQLERVQKAWDAVHPVEAIKSAFVG